MAQNILGHGLVLSVVLDVVLFRDDSYVHAKFHKLGSAILALRFIKIRNKRALTIFTKLSMQRRGA